jgi:PKD repeat protein
MRNLLCFLIILLALATVLFPLFNSVKAQTQPTVALTPPQTTVTQLNQVIPINITISNVQNLWLWTASISWDPTILSLVGDVAEGDFMTQIGNTIFIQINPENGTIPEISDTFLTANGANGSGTLAMLQFKVISLSASTTINLNNIVIQAPPVDVQHPSGGQEITPTSDHATATVTFTEGGAPAANAGPNQIVTHGTQVTLDGSSSLSSGSNPTYTWTFLDGTLQTLTGKTTTYTFSRSGIYNVKLTLIDSNGSSDSNATITVQSTSKPVAKITDGLIGQSASVGQQITFDGSTSTDANNGTVQRYLWDMGDCVGIGTNATMTYAYSQPGDYNVTLTVFDATNLNGTTSTIITITGEGVTPAPTSNPSPTPSQTSDSPTPSTTTNSTPNVNNDVQSASLPTAVLVVIVIVTVVVLGGSTFWLRKTLEPANKKET